MIVDFRLDLLELIPLSGLSFFIGIVLAISLYWLAYFFVVHGYTFRQLAGYGHSATFATCVPILYGPFSSLRNKIIKLMISLAYISYQPFLKLLYLNGYRQIIDTYK